MQAEVIYERNGWHIQIVDLVKGIKKVFGPFCITEAETLVHDYDKLREMFLNG